MVLFFCYIWLLLEQSPTSEVVERRPFLQNFDPCFGFTGAIFEIELCNKVGSRLQIYRKLAELNQANRAQIKRFV